MFQEGLMGTIGKEPPRKRKFFDWALSVGKRSCEEIQEKQHVSPLLTFQCWLGNKLVFSKIRERMGLQRLKLFFSGGAPLSKTTAEFFSAMGLTILEGYGLTETSPLVAVNRLNHVKFGTVGLPVKGVEVKLDEDCEILVRGPNVMQGYFKKPEESAETIEPSRFSQRQEGGATAHREPAVGEYVYFSNHASRRQPEHRDCPHRAQLQVSDRLDRRA
jgi:long-chain acyl-CoA synthetase